MTYVQIANLNIQYDKNTMQWLKFYIPNTTTPLSMSIDDTGTTLLSKAQFNNNGFLTTDGTTLFIPYIDQSYDAYIFKTAVDADTNNIINAIRIAKNVSPFGTSIISTIKKYAITVANGQTVIDLNTLYGIKPSAISLYINGRYQQQSSNAYTYSMITGSIILSSPLVAGDEVEVIVNDILGTSIVFNAPTSEVVSLKDYITDPNDAGSALSAACIAGRIVDFAGMTLNVINDFIMPATSICVEWRLNGTVINFKSGNCYIGKYNYFTINLQGGTIKLGAKKALLMVNSTAGGNTFTVDSTVDFSVGDILNSSFSPNYMPDSTTRIGTLGEFNTITALTATTITVKHNVPEVIPANSWVMSNRFDIRGINSDGTGTLLVKNGSISESMSGYFVGLYDKTQQAVFRSIDVVYDGAGLDMFAMECKSAYWEGGHFGRSYTIAKQGIVANHHPDGVISMKNVTVKKFNHDTLIFSNLNYPKVGDYYLENCNIDGINDRVFVGSARDYTGDNSLHIFSFPGNGSTLDLTIGNVTIIGGSIKNISRSVFGTTFDTKNSFSFKSFTMLNVIPCETDPIYISVNNYSMSKIGLCKFTNCDITSGLSVLNQGVEFTDTGKIIYENCSIKPSSALIGTATFSIARSVLNNCEIVQGALHEFYQVLGDSSEFNSVSLHKKLSPTAGQLSFLESYTQSRQTTLTLLDYDVLSSGFVDTTLWFNGVNNKAPDIKFNFPGVGSNFFYGNPDTTIAAQYRIELQADRWDSIPYQTRGYVTLYVTVNSKIIGNDGTVGRVSKTWNTTISSNAVAGDTSVVVTNANGVLVGDILGFLDLLTPSTAVYWYKVTSISGFTVTFATGLVAGLTSGDVVRGYTPVKLY